MAYIHENPVKAGLVDEPWESQKKAVKEEGTLTLTDVRKKIAAWEKAMRSAAKDMRFEDAAHARDMMRMYQEMELTLS